MTLRLQWVNVLRKILTNTLTLITHSPTVGVGGLAIPHATPPNPRTMDFGLSSCKFFQEFRANPTLASYVMPSYILLCVLIFSPIPSKP